MKRATNVHDRANLLLLPILGALTVAGLLKYVDPVHVTVVFTCYILADFIWILIEPEAVPSMPNVILLHHVVTFILLCFPLKYHQLAMYTCWDGICEINTFFLIARRQWKSVRKPFSFLYWATFFPMRIFLYPYMLVCFYREMRSHAIWELVAVCGSQIVLIGFNVVLLALSISNWKKRGSSNPSLRTRSPSSSPGAGKEERAAPLITARATAVTSSAKKSI